MFTRKLIAATATILIALTPPATPTTVKTPGSFEITQGATPDCFCEYFLYLFCR